MERYDPARNAWVKVKPMSVGRRSPGVVAHRGKLYAVGGMGEKEDLRSVEVYDPIVNRWSKLPHAMKEICGKSDANAGGPAEYSRSRHRNGITTSSSRSFLRSVLSLYPR